MRQRLASTCVLVLGVAAFAGSASAGNGTGKGKHDAGSGAPAAADAARASAPGNSASAPGQIKKEAGAAPAGVKPASDAEKDTHAAASSDKTKLYGNGTTAGQISMRNGAPAGTILHGPGSSQPHKAAACPGGHEIDVHALKGGRRRKPCGPASPPDSNPDPGHDPRPAPNPGPGPNPGGSSSGGGNAASSGGSSPGPGTNPPGSTGARAGPGTRAGSRERGGSQGVPAESDVADQIGSLPFTGFPLWVAPLAGSGLILAGLRFYGASKRPSRGGERIAV